VGRSTYFDWSTFASPSGVTPTIAGPVSLAVSCGYSASADEARTASATDVVRIARAKRARKFTQTVAPEKGPARSAFARKTRYWSTARDNVSDREVAVTNSEEFDRAIEASHRALDQIARGDPSGFFDLFSSRKDATLANPFGPPARGMTQIQEAGRRAASNYRDGRALEFETYAKYVTTDLAYVLEVERFEAKVGGSDEITPVALRTTSVFRLEGGDWKLVHRHADPITTSRPAESVIQGIRG
jgi:ketosteroid isomerase-like protein